MKTEAGLSLGSNLGDRLKNLSDARHLIATLSGVQLVAQSPVYETEPVGVKPEYRELKFLNAVLIVESPWTAREWAHELRAIEAAMGRTRGLDRYAPRTIDIDIIYLDRLRVDEAGLVIPHPRWAERRFVAQPLADVRPDLLLPGAPGTVAQVLAGLPPREGVTLFAKEW
ncbi:MAG: 2-amino-4-hydroxy-6-hydroxymethyldihydropteridine diphosphokinase [Verrucomicrobiota bacterium]